MRSRASLEDVRLHDLRHSWASRALAPGENLPKIGRLLGHSRVETTARCAHLARDSVHDAATRIAAAGIGADLLGGSAARGVGQPRPILGGLGRPNRPKQPARRHSDRRVHTDRWAAPQIAALHEPVVLTIRNLATCSISWPPWGSRGPFSPVDSARGDEAAANVAYSLESCRSSLSSALLQRLRKRHAHHDRRYPSPFRSASRTTQEGDRRFRGRVDLVGRRAGAVARGGAPNWPD